MKLFYCDVCGDFIRLAYEIKSCQCGRCIAHYLQDGTTMEWNGIGIPLFLSNKEWIKASSAWLREPNTQMNREAPFGTIPRGYKGIRINEGLRLDVFRGTPAVVHVLQNLLRDWLARTEDQWPEGESPFKGHIIDRTRNVLLEQRGEPKEQSK
jgi:hypothetical protein